METPESFEARITAALERRSEPAVPADFAARLIAEFPKQRAPRRTLRFSHSLALALCAVTLAAMVALAPHTTASWTSLAFDTEMLLTAELAVVAACLTLKWRQV